VIHQFNNDDFVTVASVPILDEHVLTARDGDVEAVVDAAFLEDVADNCNGRFAATGDAVPLVIGHTVPDAPESEQPPIVGYATNFRVGDFNDTGRQAIYCDFHVRRERESALRDYPRRSVELWVRKREIDPISLLGATTPERDLGILRYSRTDTDPFHYARECPPMQKPTKYAADDADAIKDAEKNESSGMREVSSKLDKLMEMLAPLLQVLNEGEGGEEAADEDADSGVGEGAADGDEADAEAEGGYGDDDLLGPDGGEDADVAAEAETQPKPQPEGDGEKKEAAKFRDNPVRFGSAGGNSTYLPQVTKMQRKDDDVVKLQRQIDSQSRQYEDLKLKYARSEADKLVRGLEDEGYQFADRSEDVEMLARLDEKMQQKFVEKIKKNYRRESVAIGTGDLHRYSREQVGSGEPGPKTPAEVQEAISKLKGKSWQEVEATIWAGGKK